LVDPKNVAGSRQRSEIHRTPAALQRRLGGP
jgi:hypothetical protein